MTLVLDVIEIPAALNVRCASAVSFVSTTGPRGLAELSADGPAADTRAVIVFTVVLLVVGEALALSALPEPNEGCGDVLHGLHEYAAFVLTIEAAFIGLTMLVFALTSRRDEGPT